MPRCYDAIVIGAGPAGATAARRLAEAGLSVLMLERCRLPRHKPCGGGLTAKAQGLLGIPIDHLVLNRAVAVQVRVGAGKRVRFAARRTAVWMVRRKELDLRLVEEAARRGVDVHEAEAARALELAPRASLHSDRGSYRGSVVIGADGAESRMARWLEIPRPRRWMVTLDAELEMDRGPLGGEAVVDFGIPYGYAWLFPKSDHCSVGIGSFHRGYARELHERLRRFAVETGVPLRGAFQPVGHRIPTGLGPGPLHRGNALLVGDAAGVADPFFAEGISYSLLSGHLGAEAAMDYLAGRSHDLAPYTRRLKAALRADFRLWRAVAAVVHRFPALSLGVLAASVWLQFRVEQVLAGEIGPSRHWTGIG